MAKQMAAYSQPKHEFRRVLPARCRGNRDGRGKAGSEARSPTIWLNLKPRCTVCPRSGAARSTRKVDECRRPRSAQSGDSRCVRCDRGTVKEGQIDGGASFQASPVRSTFVAGVHVKEPAKSRRRTQEAGSLGQEVAGLPGHQMECGQPCGRELPHADGSGAGKKKGARSCLAKSWTWRLASGRKRSMWALAKTILTRSSKAIDARRPIAARRCRRLRCRYPWARSWKLPRRQGRP